MPGRYVLYLRTEKSETGLRACTYSVDIRNDLEDGLENVFMDFPQEGGV